MKLTLDKSMFWVTDVSLFQKERQEASRGYFTLVQNPTKSELRDGNYKPRLTLTKRFNTTGRHEQTLSIEFSASKLLFGNNFDELDTDDYLAVIQRLQNVLKNMGIRVFHDVLLSSPVSAIHFSKNIPLTDGMTPHFIIKKIKEANISLALDINQTDYRNDGHSYKWHSNSYEVAFYDKIKDLEMAMRSDKRAIEKDNLIQLHLFDELIKNRRLEVLRMEVRLNNRQKIKQLFKTLHLNNDLTFQNLFSSRLSNCILLHYLDELESQRPKILDCSATNSKALLTDIIINNPKLGTLKVFQAFGIRQALENINPRELRAMLGKYHQRSWYRLIADIKSIQIGCKKSPFETIREKLIGFELVKLVDLQEEMLNNDKYAR